MLEICIIASVIIIYNIWSWNKLSNSLEQERKRWREECLKFRKLEEDAEESTKDGKENAEESPKAN